MERSIEGLFATLNPPKPVDNRPLDFAIELVAHIMVHDQQFVADFEALARGEEPDIDYQRLTGYTVDYTTPRHGTFDDGDPDKWLRLTITAIYCAADAVAGGAR